MTTACAARPLRRRRLDQRFGIRSMVRSLRRAIAALDAVQRQRHRQAPPRRQCLMLHRPRTSHRSMQRACWWSLVTFEGACSRRSSGAGDQVCCWRSSRCRRAGEASERRDRAAGQSLPNDRPVDRPRARWHRPSRSASPALRAQTGDATRSTDDIRGAQAGTMMLQARGALRARSARTMKSYWPRAVPYALPGPGALAEAERHAVDQSSQIGVVVKQRRADNRQ